MDFTRIGRRFRQSICASWRRSFERALLIWKPFVKRRRRRCVKIRAYIFMDRTSAHFGGAFKATKNLAKEFPGRVIDAPISEDAMVGSAVGAAIEGMRPIIEMQFADFSTVGFNQIVNQAATLFWRTNVPCPIVIRLPCGGTSGSGPFHSQMHGSDLRALSGPDGDDAGDGGGCLQHVAGSGGDR